MFTRCQAARAVAIAAVRDHRGTTAETHASPGARDLGAALATQVRSLCMRWAFKPGWGRYPNYANDRDWILNEHRKRV